MKQAILDTNFILACIKQKIDFFEDLELKGIKILIPRQSIQEIEKISESTQKLHFKNDAKLAMKILESNNFEEVDLKINNVDEGIINLAKKDRNLIIATLDKKLKEKVKNQKIAIRLKKKIEIV